MNVRSSFPNRGVTPEVQTEINRVMAIWRDCRKRFGEGKGDFLFGHFSIADATYAPVTLTASHVVNGLPSTTTLTASPDPAYALQAVTLRAKVTAASGAPTGTVTFYDSTTNVGSSAVTETFATLNTASFAAGTHSL